MHKIHLYIHSIHIYKDLRPKCFYLALMAHYAKPLSFLFLILISTSLHVEAIERLFFSKATRATTTNKNAIISELPPSPSPSPAPAPYGLYGQESDEFLPTKTTTTNTAAATTTAVFPDDENDIQTEKFSENFAREETGYTYNNNNNKNGYYQNSYNGNGYGSNYYKGDKAYVKEKQGMSDTRFLENGKYYHNSKTENNYYTALYDWKRESGNSEGYDNGNGENEFDSMEEYERRQQQQQGYYP